MKKRPPIHKKYGAFCRKLGAFSRFVGHFLAVLRFGDLQARSQRLILPHE